MKILKKKDEKQNFLKLFVNNYFFKYQGKKYFIKTSLGIFYLGIIIFTPLDFLNSNRLSREIIPNKIMLISNYIH